jgi:hypothetical protein
MVVVVEMLLKRGGALQNSAGPSAFFLSLSLSLSHTLFTPIFSHRKEKSHLSSPTFLASKGGTFFFFFFEVEEQA